MPYLNHRLLASLVISAAVGLGTTAPAFSQTASAPAAATAASGTKAEQRAARKAARKANRAKKNAELKKLEQAGYNPAQNDVNYPQNLQNAQKKINGQ